MEHSEILAVLKEVYLFAGFSEAQLGRIADQCILRELQAGEVLFQEGDRGDSFFIILSGDVLVVRKDKGPFDDDDVLVTGDFFGEVSLLSNRPRTATVKAITAVQLLELERNRFIHLVKEYPRVQLALERVIDSRRYLQSGLFGWINKDEVVYAVRRKHVAYLIITLLIPFLVLFIGLGISAFGVMALGNSTVSALLLTLGFIIMVSGLGWAGWNYLDWSNDYYVVTNRRVVWSEKVIGLYEARVEAPLSTLLSVNVITSFLGRIFGYGTVFVRTYTGEVPLRIVEDPAQLAALIEEHWHRAQRSQRQSLEAEQEQSVRQAIRSASGKPLEPSSNRPSATGFFSSRRSSFVEPGVRKTYFSNILKLRFQDGNVITYRTHWLILLKRTWLPTTLASLLILLILGYDAMYFLDRVNGISPWLVTALGILLLLLFILPWWIYNYIDWRNDIFQLTEKNIFDITRKPFGTEVKKSAALENILSLEHERPGILGYIFNFGTVTINIGEARFLFANVHEPARVQQEIFDRMYTVRQQKEKAEIAREQERVLKLLATYHRIVSEPPAEE